MKMKELAEAVNRIARFDMQEEHLVKKEEEKRQKDDRRIQQEREEKKIAEEAKKKQDDRRIQQEREEKKIAEEEIKGPASCIWYVVNAISLREEIRYCASLHLEIGSYNFFNAYSSYVEEIKFTDDGKYVFVCNSYCR